jgi:hypothetical protein
VQHILLGQNESDVANRLEPEVDLESADLEAVTPDMPVQSVTAWVEVPSMDERELLRLVSDPTTPIAQPLELEPPAPQVALTMPASAARSGHRYLRAAAIAVVFALVAGLSYWGWTQHSSAADWKAQARQLDAELSSTRADLTSTQATLRATESDLAGTKKQLTDTKKVLSDVRDQLADVTGRLATANASIDDLTSQKNSLVDQVGTLANDKAQLKDEREQLTAILSTAPAMTTALRACIAKNNEVSVELLDVISDFPYRTLDKAGRLVDDMVVLCKDAFDKTNTFDSTLTDLGV